MKKNKIMRLASGLLVAVLLTTCAISGTFAKYVTSAESSDSARVAKWGVTVSTTGNTFGGAYFNEANGNGVSTSFVASTHSVHSAGGNVVAPGTKGTLAAFAVTGQPEVDVKVTYVATIELANWNTGSEDYFPIIFTVKDITGNTETYGLSYTTATKKSDTIANLIIAVEEAIEANTTYYETLTNLSTINDDIVVSWEWPFSTSAANDVKDTALGDLGTAPTISIDVDLTIEQVD